MKKHRFFAFSIALCLSVLTLSGCAQLSEESPASQGEESSAVGQESESSPQGESAGFTHTAYPAQDAFTLQVTLQNDTVSRGEPFVLECSLENRSGRNYHIHHLPEIISYSYNGDSEYRLAMGNVSDFLDGEEITRTIEIPAAESGTITVTADFEVELNTGTVPYTYSQDFEVTVE